MLFQLEKKCKLHSKFALFHYVFSLRCNSQFLLLWCDKEVIVWYFLDLDLFTVYILKLIAFCVLLEFYIKTDIFYLERGLYFLL